MGLKYQVNECFFDEWSTPMAYVLGYIFADGSMEDSPSIRGKYVRVLSTDRDRIDTIRGLLKSEHTVYVEPPSGNRKERYLLQIGSARLFAALLQHGITCRKSFTMLFPPVPNQYLAPFALGYFDGDGCAFIERNKTGGVRRLLSIYTSGSKAFLTELHRRLVGAIGMSGSGLYKHGSSVGTYQLRYFTRDSLRLMSFLYASPELIELAMKRKYDIFSEYADLRGITPQNLPRILKQKGPVVN